MHYCHSISSIGDLVSVHNHSYSLVTPASLAVGWSNWWLAADCVLQRLHLLLSQLPTLSHSNVLHLNTCMFRNCRLDDQATTCHPLHRSAALTQPGSALARIISIHFADEQMRQCAEWFN